MYRSKGYGLVELLVVMGIMTTMMAILLPVATKARLEAKILAVKAELRQIGLALEAYSLDNAGLYPPTRVDCMLGGHYYQLPTELVTTRYLPAPPADTFMASGIEDRFNRGYTYKYQSVGTMIYNRTTVIEGGAMLWVPDGFPEGQEDAGQWYSEPAKSPVSWVVYSLGPRSDPQEQQRLKQLKPPVPRSTWYGPDTKRGLIVRMRLRNGSQIGTF